MLHSVSGRWPDSDGLRIIGKSIDKINDSEPICRHAECLQSIAARQVGSKQQDDSGRAILSQFVPKEKLAEYIGRRLQAEEWTKITQERIDQFADATDDHQFIHVDPLRARQSPFGTTVAHGFLTLSLLPKLLEPIQLIPEDVVMGVNYGQNRVRYPHPVPCDAEIRAASTLLEVRDMAPDRILLKSKVVVEIRGVEKPALVVESLAMFVLGGQDEPEFAGSDQ